MLFPIKEVYPIQEYRIVDVSNSGVEHSPSMSKALDSMPRTVKIETSKLHRKNL